MGHLQLRRALRQVVFTGQIVTFHTAGAVVNVAITVGSVDRYADGVSAGRRGERQTARRGGGQDAGRRRPGYNR